MIGKLCFAAQGISQELAAELADDSVPAMFEQVISQAGHPVDRTAIRKLGFRIEGNARLTPLAASANGVESFQGKTKRVDSLVTFCAGHVTAVPFDHLPFRQSRRNGVGQLRHVLRRTRQLFAEQHFADPVAAQDRTGPRGSGLLGENRGESKYPAPSVPIDSVDSPPGSPFDSFDAVELRHPFVDERVIRVQKRQERSVFLEQVGEKQDRLFVHVATQISELGKQLLALGFRHRKVVNVQPLAAKLRPQATNAGIFKHSSSLPFQHLGMGERSRSGGGS